MPLSRDKNNWCDRTFGPAPFVQQNFSNLWMSASVGWDFRLTLTRIFMLYICYSTKSNFSDKSDSKWNRIKVFSRHHSINHIIDIASGWIWYTFFIYHIYYYVKFIFQHFTSFSTLCFIKSGVEVVFIYTSATGIPCRQSLPPM